jgi:hypothetical protein
VKIAILDDYQNAALKMADWSALSGRAEITVFNDHVADPSALVERLLPFEVVCVMRERTPLPREVLQHLPRLKLIASTGSRNASTDMGAAKELGIAVTATGYRSSPTIEMTWALILASLRGIVHENNSIRNGGWQKSVGQDLSGKTLGVVGGLAMSAGRSRELVLNSYGGEVETFAQHIIKANTIDTLKFLNDESFELRDRFPAAQGVRDRGSSIHNSGVKRINSAPTSTTLTGAVGSPSRDANLVPSSSFTKTLRCCGLFWNFTT